MSLFMNFLVTGLTVGSFYALVGIGFTMVYAVLRLINFAHGDLYMVGAFIGFSVLGLSLSIGMPVALAISLAFVGAMVVAGVISVGIVTFTFQPLLRRAPPLSLLLAAVGASLVLENGVSVIYGVGFQTYPHLISSKGLSVGGLVVSFAQAGIFIISMGLAVGLWLFLQRTTTGMAMRAVSMNQDSARLMGINVNLSVRLIFFVAAALAGAAGVMSGLYYTQISFFMGFSMGLKGFTAAVVGGIGSVPGAVAGGLAMGVAESLVSGYTSAKWSDVVVFVILILTLTVKPTGLLGEHVVSRM